MNKLYVTTNELIDNIKSDVYLKDINHTLTQAAADNRTVKIYAVPRGGVPASYLFAKYFSSVNYEFVDILNNTVEVIIDDLIDSGRTQKECAVKAPDAMYAVLINKLTDDRYKGKWIVFPWEGTAGADNDTSGDDIIVRLLEYVGEDANREGLLETPKRVLKAWKNEWCGGYGKDPEQVLKVFEDGSEGCDQMVVVRDIPIFSHCEHHLAPFFGTATIGYIPNKKIVGLSKLSRVADIFAHRLQVQERLTNQIADAIWGNLAPIGVGVVINCRHMCMESRGVSRSGSTTITSALRGAIRDDSKARAEFLTLAHK